MAKRFVNNVCCFIISMLGLFYVFWNGLVGMDLTVTIDKKGPTNLNNPVSTAPVNIIFPRASRGETCRIIQNLTHSRVKSICEKISENYTRIHKKQVPRALFVTEGILGYCHVPKVASSAWMTMFAELNFMSKGLVKDKLKTMSLHDYIFNRYSLVFPNDAVQLSKLYKFVFIRHPFERLVSAFHDKFVTIQQMNLMQPFINYHLNRTGIKRPVDLSKSTLHKFVNVTFNSFVDFVLYENSLESKISPPSWHWWPSSDLCKVCEMEYDYLGTLETFHKDVSCILQEFPDYNILQEMKNKIKEKVNASGHHNKSMTMDYFSQLSKQTIIHLYEMFKVDFQLGAYDYPQKYINVGKHD